MQEDPAEWAQVDAQDELWNTGENMSYLAQTTGVPASGFSVSLGLLTAATSF